MSIAKVPTDQIAKELERRKRRIARVKIEYASMVGQVAMLQRRIARAEAEIIAFGGEVRKRRPGTRRPHTRGRYGEHLAGLIYKVLEDRSMRIPDIADAVRKSGFSLALFPDFNTVVTIALLAKRNRKLFKRVGRGTYARAS